MEFFVAPGTGDAVDEGDRGIGPGWRSREDG